MKRRSNKMGRNGVLRYVIVALIIDFLVRNSYPLAVDGGNTLSLGASLTGNQTIVSQNGMFELGFFSPSGTNNWYVGIWYARVSEKTIIWVANRETPMKNKPGILNLSRDGHLRLFDAQGRFVWSANSTKKASEAVILESGNFLILGYDNKSDPVWRSFDHPVDTWLSGMEFGGQRKFVCWKNSMDPAPGAFSFEMDPSGAKQFVLKWNNSVQYWKSGVWNGKIFSQVPEMSLSMRALYNINTQDSSSGFYLNYTMIPTVNWISRFVLDKSGAARLYNLLDDNKWSMFWSQPADQCTVYNLCGAYGTCNPNNLQFCSCVEGFKPKDSRAWDLQEWWSAGCVRQSPLNCDAKNGSSGRFKDLSVSLPENQASSYPGQNKKDCEKTCLRNCSCTAFSYEQPSGPCRIWFGDLLNMRNSPSKSSSEVFIRVGFSARELDSSSFSKSKTTAIAGAVLGAVAALAVFLLFTFLRWHKRRLRSSTETCPDSSNLLLKMFTYKELKIATRNFRHKLGSGGFGSVFKGALIDGTPVAVKKLEGSRQGEKQFRAEISSVGNIQHVNLVRLRGICAEGSRRLLVYDYMPNGSLNSFLFNPKSKSKGKVLEWNTRVEIALGTARGLAYLHDKCRDRIIHGDVKPENILLDGDFSPKLGDFGLAKIVGRDFSGVVTTIRGTRGYLAPEWISGLPITPKVDVYSFGMTLLEIISGRRNLDLKVQESSKYYFPSWAATQIQQGNVMNIVDERVAEKANVEEVGRACVVSLLCIQEEENARPSMEQVVVMLEGKMEAHTPLRIIVDNGDGDSE